MPSKKNIANLEELKTKLQKAKSVILTDYRGLSVNKLNELRRRVKESGGEYKVFKNTLINLGLTGVEQNQLISPTAVLFSYEDEIASLKILYQFAQENELPTIKLGLIDNKFVEKQQVIYLAQLPGKEALQAKLVGIIQSPIYGLVYVLKGNLSKLVRVLNGIKEKKS